MMASENQNFVALIEALTEKTVKGKIRWDETSAEDKFLTALPNGISFFVDCRPSGTCSLSMHDERGRLIRVMVTEPNDTDYESIAGLHSIARSQVLNIPGKLDEAMAAIKSL